MTIEAMPKGWETRLVWRKTRETNQVMKRVEVIDCKSGTRYPHDSMGDIALKSFFIFFGAVPYAAIYMAWHLVRIPIAATRALVDGRGVLAVGVVVRSLWGILKAPFYAIRLLFAAICGVFCPLEGRKQIAKIEGQWHDRERWDEILALPGSCVEKTWQALSDPENRMTRFLAHCMQPYGSLSDPRVIRSELVLPEASPAA
jgi:hypothetical protein